MIKRYALFALTFLITPAAASAATTVSPTHVTGTALAVSPSGRTVVAWEHRVDGRYVVEARVGASARSLGPVRRFAHTSGKPYVAAGADGTVAVELATSPLSVAIARPGHSFGTPRTIGGSSSGFVRPAGVTVRPDGSVLALYTRNDVANLAIARPGRPFLTSRTIAPIALSSTPTLAVDPRDGAVVVGYATRAQTGGPNSQAAVATIAPGATRFSEPVALTNLGIDGEATVAVSTGSGGVAAAAVTLGEQLELATREASGAWTPPRPVATIDQGGSVGPQSFPYGFTAVPLLDGATASAWLLGLDEDPYTGPARLQAFAAMTPAAGLAAAPQPFTGADRRLTALALVAAGDDAFAATVSQNGPVTLATQAAGAPTFTPRTLAPDGDGDIVLAAGGEHVLAAYQRGDRIRLATVR